MTTSDHEGHFKPFVILHTKVHIGKYIIINEDLLIDK